MAQLLGMLRSFAVVQRKRIVLVLNDDVRSDPGGVSKPAAQIDGQWLRPVKDLAVINAHLSAVTADRRQREWRKQTINIADPPTTHQCDRTTRQLVQPCERPNQCNGNLHLVRRWADVDNCAIHIEEQCDFFQIQAGKYVHHWVISNYLHNYNSVRYKKVRWIARR